MSNNIQAEFKALQDNQKVLTIMIFSLITVVVWVILSLVRSQRSETIDPELTALSQPLNPSINTEVLTEIEQKRAYSEAELRDFPIYIRRTTETAVSPFSGAALASPQPTTIQEAITSPTPSATTSANQTSPSPTTVPTATDSGTL